MKVRVRLFATLRSDGNKEADIVSLPDNSLVRDLLKKQGIDPVEVGVLIVNNRDATFDQSLEDDDCITVIPHIGGG